MEQDEKKALFARIMQARAIKFKADIESGKYQIPNGGEVPNQNQTITLKVGDKVEWRPDPSDEAWAADGWYSKIPRIGVTGIVTNKPEPCSDRNTVAGKMWIGVNFGLGHDYYPLVYCKPCAVTKDSRCDGCAGECNSCEKDDCCCDGPSEDKKETKEIDVREYCVHKWVWYWGMNTVNPQYEYCEKCGEKK